MKDVTAEQQALVLSSSSLPDSPSFRPYSLSGDTNRELVPPLWVAIKKLPLFGEAVEGILDTLSKPPETGIYERRMVSADTSNVATDQKGFEFSIMTYNVLAECYVVATRYAHCPEYARRWSYRGKQILKEITIYMPDVIVLQEVDHYSDFFEPALALLGYKGLYAKRSTFRLDGCALFYKEAKFDLISSTRIEYNDLAKIKKNDNYKRDNVAILATLQPKTSNPNKESRRVIVATTHFFWNPEFAYVKTEQAQYLLDRVRDVYQNEKNNAAVFIAGDFNSVPESEVYSIFGDNSLNLSSAYSTFGEPETHFTTHYYGCLDYIWHTSQHAKLLEVLQPIPPKLCESKCEFPSPVFPSDHLPLMAKYVLTDDGHT